MVSADELDGFRKDRYFSRAWALLTQQRGWIKPVLVLTVCLLVPIVGWLGVIGYAAEWARLTAWGVNAAPKQRGVRVGECLASGWRAFVVLLVWGVCWAVIGAIASEVPLIDDLLRFVWSLVGIFLGVVEVAAVVRAAVYQKIVPGLRVGTIWQMVRHDPAGLLRIMGMGLLAGLGMGLLAALVAAVMLMSVLPQIIYLGGFVSDYYSYYYTLQSSELAAAVVSQVLRMIGSVGLPLMALALVEGLVGVVVCLLVFTAVGLWMRQFNVSAWGRDEDPLPPFVRDPRDEAASAGVPPTGWGVPPEPVAPEGPGKDEEACG